MHEAILRDYFEGRVSESDLKADLDGAVVQLSEGVFTYKIVDMDSEFLVTPEHLTNLCDAILSGSLEAECLRVIGFCLIASDTFIWDSDTESGSRINETVHDWASPEINYPLTIETVRKFRERLLTGTDTLDIC